MSTNKKLWHYHGPHYYDGIKQVGEFDLYTSASSYREAKRNVIWKIKKFQHYSRFADVDIDAGQLSCEETVVVKSRKAAKKLAGDQLCIFPKGREE